ncbi:MAG TPA: CsbD family protein [Tetrasphaera sp.]|uniref:CsbD family protein n=1 Tax=Nostocoides sp. TaxID=1917966 RepID=UPI002CE67454|nr:CsbD family protein [Tetrasphaera sp.]HNQ06936.1 CsbD family protein [Tetrasphaera sp.]
MGIGDKISNATEEAVGKVKEKVGDATDNERLQAEGLTEQAEANVKQAAERAGDAVDDARDAAKDAFGS